MADYYMQVIGQFAGSLAWSFGQHISSPATEVSLAGRWHDTWAYAWAAGGTGINTLYPTGTAITAVSVSTLNGTMHEVSKTVLPLPLAGISSDDTLPFLTRSWCPGEASRSSAMAAAAGSCRQRWKPSSTATCSPAPRPPASRPAWAASTVTW